MNKQENNQSEEIKQDVEMLKEQITKILESITTQKGKVVAQTSGPRNGISEVEDTSMYPTRFTP